MKTRWDEQDYAGFAPYDPAADFPVRQAATKPPGTCRCGGAWISPPHVPRGIWMCGACGCEYVPGMGRVVSRMVRRVVGMDVIRE